MIRMDRCQPEPAMKLQLSAASVISQHVVFELESIHRVHLNVYVPRPQRQGGVAAFFPSSAPFCLECEPSWHEPSGPHIRPDSRGANNEHLAPNRSKAWLEKPVCRPSHSRRDGNAVRNRILSVVHEGNVDRHRWQR